MSSLVALRNPVPCISPARRGPIADNSLKTERHDSCPSKGMVRFEWTQAYETDAETASLLEAAAAAGEEASVLSMLILGIRSGAVRVVGR
jgi:hypothetical protein